MNNLVIIITMAGMGSRFRKEGYNVPKYMIGAKGKTLFEWSMSSLTDFNEHVEKYLFIVQKQDSSREFIEEKCRLCGISKYEIVEIDGLTDGQATTCMKAMPYCSPLSPIFIYNIDTYVEPYEMKYESIVGDGHIPCFHAEGDHWSFISLGENGYATEVREKVRISDYCSIGAYYFSSAGLFSKIYYEYFANPANLVNGEKYVAPMYNYLIGCGKNVSICVVDSSKVHTLGTPEELGIFLKSEF